MGFPVCALAAALFVLFVSPASPAGAAIEVPRGSALTFEWTPSVGKVSAYFVYVECNGVPEAQTQMVRVPRATVRADLCDTVRLRVAAFGPQGLGPLSRFSRRIRFVDSLEPPVPDPGADPAPDPEPLPPEEEPPPRPVASDFDGDGRADLLMRNAETGAAALWSLAGGAAAVVAELPELAASLEVVGDGDLDADGDPDLLLWDPASGQLSAWLLEGGQRVAAGDLGQPLPEGWRPAGHADFDGDGRADVLLHAAATGELELWSGDGLAIGDSGPLSHLQEPGFRLAATPDADGDGRADLVWHDPERGLLDVWTLDARRLVRNRELPTGLDGTFWSVAASDDFDGDGVGDLLWRHRADGRLGIWFLAGGDLASQVLLPGPGRPHREALASGDWNGDGRADLLQRRRRGGLLVLFLDGAAELGLEKVGMLQPPWFVANVGAGREAQP